MHPLYSARGTWSVSAPEYLSPDKALNIQKPGFVEYMGKLAEVVGKEKLACIDCVCDALTKRIEFFVEMGCRATDHGLDYVPYREATKEEVNAIYQKAMAGEAVTVEETEMCSSGCFWPRSLASKMPISFGIRSAKI